MEYGISVSVTQWQWNAKLKSESELFVCFSPQNSHFFVWYCRNSLFERGMALLVGFSSITCIIKHLMFPLHFHLYYFVCISKKHGVMCHARCLDWFPSQSGVLKLNRWKCIDCASGCWRCVFSFWIATGSNNCGCVLVIWYAAQLNASWAIRRWIKSTCCWVSLIAFWISAAVISDTGSREAPPAWLSLQGIIGTCVSLFIWSCFNSKATKFTAASHSRVLSVEVIRTQFSYGNCIWQILTLTKL